MQTFLPIWLFFIFYSSLTLLLVLCVMCVHVFDARFFLYSRLHSIRAFNSTFALFVSFHVSCASLNFATVVAIEMERKTATATAYPTWFTESQKHRHDELTLHPVVMISLERISFFMLIFCIEFRSMLGACFVTSVPLFLTRGRDSVIFFPLLLFCLKREAYAHFADFNRENLNFLASWGDRLIEIWFVAYTTKMVLHFIFISKIHPFKMTTAAAAAAADAQQILIFIAPAKK